MKKQIIAVLIILLTGFSTSTFAFEHHRGNLEDIVWQREVLYWDLLQDLNLEDYMELWHPNFRGWPSYASEPADKDAIEAATAYSFSTAMPGTFVYELTKYDVNILRNTVTTFYTFTYSYQTLDGEEVSVSGRIIHTWMRFQGKWVIVNGMSGPN